MLKTALERILFDWQKEKKSQFKDNELARYIRNDFKQIVEGIVNTNYPAYEVKASAGAGVWADVPWLSILNPNITDSTQDGIYPVFLFRADSSGVYLSLNQGTTTPQEDLGKVAAKIRAAQIISTLNTKLPKLAKWIQGPIDLKSKTKLGVSYQTPNIGAKFYAANSIPDEAQLIADLNELLGIYAQAEAIWLANFTTQTLASEPIETVENIQIQLPKPFLLLAGISGTGKSRFVREQARMQSASGDLSYLEQIAVRPDWHEPSDLLGYVSRIGGEYYVATPFLKFIAKAWRDAFVSVDTDGFYTLNPEAKTHWVCLDEMNLAPVEQYFADYLSLIETRKWQDGKYRSDAIFKPFELPFTNANKKSALNHLAEELGFASGDDALWLHFCGKDVGMPIPPNLIVAGTVNMDETTHGFSRKVIDRALTIDFGVFFPNVFSAFLAPTTNNKKISYSTYSDVEGVDLSTLKYTAADGTEVRMVDASIALMTEINAVVKGTPFELAYRALNEMLVALACYAPTDEPTLHAVWDDFLMGKLLPRLEGDAEKLHFVDDKNSLLTQLSALLTNRLHSGAGQRPDLLRENKDNSPLLVEYRSLEKLDWMQKRLVRDSFTSFWP